MGSDSRRRLLLGAVLGTGAWIAGCAARAGGAPVSAGKREGEAGEEEIGATEDLMREHGILNRILLVYDEGVRRIDAGQPVPVEALRSSADVIKRFIEGYHERLEEDHLFPRFEKANTLRDLVATLRAQHEAGRRVTQSILERTAASAAQGNAEKKTLADAMRAFTRMYRPHEAREDTVLFPALHRIVSHKELEELGEQFEEQEHKIVGERGFEGVVAQVDGIEQSLGIHDLEQFTPR